MFSTVQNPVQSILLDTRLSSDLVWELRCMKSEEMRKHILGNKVRGTLEFILSTPGSSLNSLPFNPLFLEQAGSFLRMKIVLLISE